MWLSSYLISCSVAFVDNKEVVWLTVADGAVLVELVVSVFILIKTRIMTFYRSETEYL